MSGLIVKPNDNLNKTETSEASLTGLTASRAWTLAALYRDYYYQNLLKAKLVKNYLDTKYRTEVAPAVFRHPDSADRQGINYT